MAPGIDAATASPASTEFDELTTTVAPRSPRRRATASPIPLDEPVTIATLPESSPVPMARASQNSRSLSDPEWPWASVSQPDRSVRAEFPVVERPGRQHRCARWKVDRLSAQVDRAGHRAATEGEDARAEVEPFDRAGPHPVGAPPLDRPSVEVERRLRICGLLVGAELREHSRLRQPRFGAAEPE